MDYNPFVGTLDGQSWSVDPHRIYSALSEIDYCLIKLPIDPENRLVLDGEPSQDIDILADPEEVLEAIRREFGDVRHNPADDYIRIGDFAIHVNNKHFGDPVLVNYVMSRSLTVELAGLPFRVADSLGDTIARRVELARRPGKDKHRKFLAARDIPLADIFRVIKGYAQIVPTFHGLVNPLIGADYYRRLDPDRRWDGEVRHILHRGFPNEPEKHLFVVWSGAYHIRQRVIDDLSQRFRVLSVVPRRWDSALSREGGGWKWRKPLVGEGEFTVITVLDLHPNYELRVVYPVDRMRVAEVNSNTLDAKFLYRSWASNDPMNILVHSTLNPEEYQADSRALLRVSI